MLDLTNIYNECNKYKNAPKKEKIIFHNQDGIIIYN